MVVQGQVRNGVVVPEAPAQLPEGVSVQILLPASAPPTEPAPRREGGQWRGRVKIAEDFDELPDDLAEAFGVQSP